MKKSSRERNNKKNQANILKLKNTKTEKFNRELEQQI